MLFAVLICVCLLLLNSAPAIYSSTARSRFQHIDVFTGIGSAAEQETFRITSDNNRVCFTNNATAQLNLSR